VIEFGTPDRQTKPQQRPHLVELQVWFNREDPDDLHSASLSVASVRLTLAEPLKPRALQHFPWAKYLDLAHADAWAFCRGSTRDDAMGGTDRAYRRGWPDPEQSHRRPGRRGNGDDHYRTVADEYIEFRSRGIRNVDKLIAEKRQCSPSTVRGWAREARRRGFLPRATPGRPPGSRSS
jgi:hypothetical protein